MQVTHRLKTHPGPFEGIRTRVKKHETRKDDRGFEVGDLLGLCEWDPAVQRYTGRYELVRVSYITRGPDYGIPEGVVVMSFDLLFVHEGEKEIDVHWPAEPS